MNPPTYLIRPAVAEDVDAILALRTEAEDWLRQRGIRQWTDDYHEYARDVLRTSVAAGATWVVEDGCRIVATVSVVREADRDFWDPGDDLTSALYLGKMIVARSHAGRQLGAAVVNWASLRAKALNLRRLRIDVRRDNERLHRYYLDQGWKHVRTVYPPRRRTESGTLFERPAGRLTLAESVVSQGAATHYPFRSGDEAESADITNVGYPCGEDKTANPRTSVVSEQSERI